MSDILITAVMPATSDNFRLISGVEGMRYTLSFNPRPGEVWKNGYGNEFKLYANPDDNINTLTDRKGSTWLKTGVYYSNSCVSRYDLIERVSTVQIRDGEYWVDKKGNVFRVKIIDTNNVYCVYAPESLHPNRSWTIHGTFLSDGNSHDYDLVKKLVYEDN
jgi:hypothetical protein